MTAQEIRDEALAQLVATREAERHATEAHRDATAAWLLAICQAPGRIERQAGRVGLVMCCEAPGHPGEHRNLVGDAWSGT